MLSTPSVPSWSTHQLETWLRDHNIAVRRRHPTISCRHCEKPTGPPAQQYGSDQYHTAQPLCPTISKFGVRHWTSLRSVKFLLDPGHSRSSGPREQLVSCLNRKLQRLSARHVLLVVPDLHWYLRPPTHQVDKVYQLWLSHRPPTIFRGSWTMRRTTSTQPG